MDRRTRKRKNTNTNSSVNSNMNINSLTVSLMNSRRNPKFSPIQAYANRLIREVNSYAGRYPPDANWETYQMRIRVNGTEMLVRPTVDKDGFMIGMRKDGGECAFLLMATDEHGVKYGNLHGVKKGDSCYFILSDNMVTPSRNLVLAAWKLCYLYNMDYMVLDDISKIPCADGISFNLADMYLLKHGETWYQSIIPLYGFPKKKGQPTWEENQQRARIVTWGEMSKGLTEKDIQTDLPFTVGRENDLARNVIRDIHQTKDSCLLFYRYMGLFLYHANLYPARDYRWRTPPIRTSLPRPSR
jgi:hypothetical protein